VINVHVPAISARNLTRLFYPRQGFFRKGEPMVAVDGVDLTIPTGTIFGLLGPNGAGKTTTIKMISTLLVPSDGEVSVAGFDVASQEHDVRKRLGVLLGGDRGLYGKISAVDNLRFFATLYGVPPAEVEGRVQTLLQMTGLSHRQSERVEGFSRGMKQRMHLARALIHDPEVVILDEPTIGLDPDAAVQLRKVVRSLVPEKTVLLTTHYLAEADELCDRIAIIDGGRIIAEDTPEGIKGLVGSGEIVEILVRGYPADPTLEALRLSTNQSSIRAHSDRFSGTTRIEISSASSIVTERAAPILIADGYPVLEIRRCDVSLEEAFLSLTGSGQHGFTGGQA
jgi:ABC-2 type transport system ATP-binding protein